MTSIKTSPNKKIAQSSDWVQFKSIDGAVRNINLNLIEEVAFYPDISGEPEITIFYSSGRQREFRGEEARLLWNLVNQGITFEMKRSQPSESKS